MKRLLTTATAALALAAVAAATGAGAPNATVRLAARLNTAQQVPKPKVAAPSAVGYWSATLRGETLSWTLRYSNLTGRALSAHLHFGRRGRSGDVLALICSPCRSGKRGAATLTAGVRRALLAGRMYVEIHTRQNRTGEIRGQVTKRR